MLETEKDVNVAVNVFILVLLCSYDMIMSCEHCCCISGTKITDKRLVHDGLQTPHHVVEDDPHQMSLTRGYNQLR